MMLGEKRGMILQNCPCTLKGITKNVIGVVFVSKNLCLFIIYVTTIYAHTLALGYI